MRNTYHIQNTAPPIIHLSEVLGNVNVTRTTVFVPSCVYNNLARKSDCFNGTTRMSERVRRSIECSHT